MLVLLFLGSRNHDFRVHANGITSSRNFIQIRQPILELNRADRRTDRQTRPVLYELISYTSRKERIIMEPTNDALVQISCAAGS
jgi:hypothetical protein